MDGAFGRNRPVERLSVRVLIRARSLPTGQGTGTEGEVGMHEGSPDGRQAPRTPTAWLRPPAPQDPVMELLEHHLPLSLIMDLVMPAGPRSGELLADEPPVDTAWLAGLDAPQSGS